ncbi:ABC transporter ATP-binding protein [Ferrovibrio xuzhouensis]|uniref:Dipeptide ABC transporter ATP-binding protein n=1 Tax=Ferrovibrio xuzhouensis TaxID=1576914 RepID=A0ABV7VKV2_9PROT
MTDQTRSAPAIREPVLELDSLRISYFTRAGEINVVPGLDLKLYPGEAIGLVGESGCGKSTIGYAIMRYLGGAGRIMNGRVLFEGRDLYELDADALRRLRGNRMAMVYQDPMSSLNPTMTVGEQLMEVPVYHDGASRQQAYDRALTMLDEVNLPDPASIMARYPHQLSGGQQQRVVIAMALMAKPALLIMDEPTTGLDVTVEAAVLDLIATLRRKHKTSIVFISHNLGTVVRICDRIGVLYAGELVEEGPIREVFRDPRHPYTRGLLSCLPTLDADKHSAPLVPIRGSVTVPRNRPPGCVFATRCEFKREGLCTSDTIPMGLAPDSQRHRVRCARQFELPAPQQTVNPEEAAERAAAAAEPLLEIDDLRKYYDQSAGMGFIGNETVQVKALDGISLRARRGETLAIVGESGCGKSTLAKVLTGLETATGGKVALDEIDLTDMGVAKRPDEVIRRLQMVFQNPDSTLNPSHTIGYTLERPLRQFANLDGEKLKAKVKALLKSVNLPAEFARRKPRQLSGGQKQRVAIARALAGSPEVIIADEPVSALDVSVQAAIINLLAELQTERQTTLLFISHDLSVVRYLADRVAVMYLGKIMEYGRVGDVFAPPYHPYTEALLSAVPVADPSVKSKRIVLEGKPPSVLDRPPGCPFAGRCHRKIGDICDTQEPPEQRFATGHRIACHLPREELAGMDHVINTVVAAE